MYNDEETTTETSLDKTQVKRAASPSDIGDLVLDHANGGDIPFSLVMNDMDLLIAEVNMKDWVSDHTVMESRRILSVMDTVAAEHQRRAAIVVEIQESIRNYLHDVANTNREVPTVASPSR